MKNINKGILFAGTTLLTLTRCAYGFEDTLYKMFEQTDIPRNIKFETTWEKVDVKTIIKQSLECSKNLRKIFEEIAKDEVGSLALRAFYQGQKALGTKLRIIEDRPFITQDGKELTNIFIEDDFAYLNLEKLQKENITTIGWCNGRIFPKKETSINIIFHEFVHATHYITDGERDNTMETLDKIYGNNSEKYLWTYCVPNPETQKFVHEEEFYTIHGTFWSNGQFQYNPINCGLFEANRQHKAGIPVENIMQRIFHREYNVKYEKLSIQYIDKVTTDFKKIFVDKNI